MYNKLLSVSFSILQMYLFCGFKVIFKIVFLRKVMNSVCSYLSAIFTYEMKKQ